MRPIFTTACHSSTLPLPCPMRVSAGFLVTGFSGNTRIHTFPPRLIKQAMARRPASTCRAALAVPLVPGHLRPAQPAGAGHADALGAELLRRLDGFLHRPAESDAALELRGDVLSHQLGVGFRLADFDDVQEHLVLRELLQ